MRPSRIVAFFLFIAAAASADAQDVWTLADIALVRLPPSAFEALPAEIRTDLDRRGCRVPQTLDDTRPHNVISGDLLGRGAREWAVLCSINRISRVLVYEAGGMTAFDSLDTRLDRFYVQQVSGARVGFSRMITSVSPDRLRRIVAKQKGNALEPTRDGIEIAFIGKASFIAYWTGKRWTLVAASD
jgi:hypothetical protein